MPLLWRITGGADKGGILVRETSALKSAARDDRLSTGAEVEELALEGERLRYRLRNGAGPAEGWISIRVTGKDLAVRIDELSGARRPHAAGETPKVEKPAEAPASAPADAGAGDGASDGAGGAGGAGVEPDWIGESRRKMQAYKDGTPMPAPPCSDEDVPVRLRYGHPSHALPPHHKLLPKEMAEMSVKNLPGHWTSMKFPHNTEQLRSFGAEWYTEAFHKFGTLPPDNRVKRVVEVYQLPHSGFDAAGGAGHKAFITVEYEKPDPNLHTKLFAKFPWDYHESATGQAYRMQISSQSGDLDGPELLTYMCCEHLLPFRIPKLYFCEINRDTTNYILITERIPFGRRGRIEHGKVVEKIARKPYEVLPVCGKYQDYLLEDPAQIYFAIFREMAHLAAWDQQGRFDSYFGPNPTWTEAEYLLSPTGAKQKQKAKRAEVLQNAAKLLLDQGIDFATNVAPQIFTAAGKDKKMLAKMKEDLVRFMAHNQDVQKYCNNESKWVAAMHSNLQADNAYFWYDEHGNLDAGVFDWCAFGRVPFVMNFMGCLSGADADFLDAHEEGLMKLFCDEHKRYGGPQLEWQELLLRYRLQWPNYVVDCCRWVERDIYRECPKEEWHSVKDIYDDKFVGRWNVRCRGTSLVNALEFWPRRDFAKICDEWMQGKGKEYLTSYTL